MYDSHTHYRNQKGHQNINYLGTLTCYCFVQIKLLVVGVISYETDIEVLTSYLWQKPCHDEDENDEGGNHTCAHASRVIEYLTPVR